MATTRAGQGPGYASPEPARGRGAPGRRQGADRWARRIAGIAVILLWAAWALLSLLGGHQLVHHSQAVEDLSYGRMTSFELVADRPGGVSSSTAGWWTGQDLAPASVEDVRTGTAFVVYTVAGARPRLVVPDRMALSTTGWGSWTESEMEWIEAELVTSGLPSTVAASGRGSVAQAHGLLGLVLALSMLLRVVFGRAPVHGTRWFWFWLIGLPAGLGVLAYAIWEEGGWRDHRAPAPQQRSTGGYGFAVLLLGSFLLTAGAQLLTWLLGVTVIPL